MGKSKKGVENKDIKTNLAEDLVELEKRFSLIVETASDGVSFVDADGIVVYCSDRIEKLYGYRKEEIIGKRVTDFLLPESVRTYKNIFLSGISDEGLSAQLLLRRKNGRPVNIQRMEYPIENTGLKLAYDKDIDEKLRHEELIQLQGVALQSLANSVVITNLRGDIVWVNSAFRELTGYEKEEILYKNISILKSGFHRKIFYKRMWQQILQGKVWKGELLNRRKDGTCYNEEQTITPVKGRDGLITNFIALKEDITARKQWEEKIKKINEELERRVDERSKQLVESEKMAALGELVAGVSHEINTPLGIGVTATTLLEDKTKELYKLYKTDELTRTDLESYITTAIDSVHYIYSNLKRAADLVRSFKQIAVDQTSEERREFNLTNYIDEILLSLKPEIKKKNCRVQKNIKNDFVLYSYPGTFSQIFTNLIMNSLIHAFENSSDSLIMIEYFKENKYLVIKYDDNGSGIKKENMKKIFEPFFTSRRGQGGCGLGLPIVYNLVVQNLKGEINCESKFGSGTTFIIKIPWDNLNTAEKSTN